MTKKKIQEASGSFWSRVRKTPRCWLWTGPVRGTFGRFSWKGSDWTAHRAAWELSGRRVPPGGQVLRSCGNLLCVRPGHLRISRRRSLSGAKRSASLEKRFWDRVKKRREGCWPWLGAKDRYGYGTLRVEGSSRLAPRVAWVLTHEAIPSGKMVLHECGRKDCVRPEHLRLGTKADLHDPIEERLWSRVRRTQGCWWWEGAQLPEGHGVMASGGRNELVARVVWRLKHGRIPANKQVLHTCHEPRCVRPGHLRLGSRSDVMRDMAERGRLGRQLHPERYPRGDNHPLRKNPELACRGEDSPRSILTEEEVLDIRARYPQGGVSHRELGEEYGVHPTTIGYVVRGGTWRHLL
jgi:HNH endonuclease